MIRFSNLLFVVVMTFGISEFCSAGPLHAQCKVEWYFGLPCRSVYEALVTQIKKWKTVSTCATGGEKCLYKLQSASVHFISAKHTTATKKDTEDINFRLVSYGFFTHCHVSAVDSLKLQDIKRSQVTSCAPSGHLPIVLCINANRLYSCTI
ncbi:uncharacterized protein [Paramisgurnus dabryanus]|uniref:uncharacterized protein isoform X2 n=1 Tax=Paramisgurnus dabryanus TaxID=90735 RepID=UPI0031F3E4C5